ncbi:MAG: enoyl-CoA hydratase [Gammaproteobacteria bacterium]|nr:enoyl-CoA hydratase [Gammaproteobacteria bacterium]
MSDEKVVLFGVEDGVATIRLNRPDMLNAMTDELMQGISHAIDSVRDNESVRVVILTGEGRGFCAGADLQQVAQPQEQKTDAQGSVGKQDTFNQALTDVMNCPVPTIARVNGAAAGGGFGLALACDITIAAESAFFVATFGPNLGIVPDMGTTWNVPLRAGRAKALGIALLGERITAAQAADWGLIWASVSDAELDLEVRRVSEILKSSSPDAAVRIRETINECIHSSFEEQLALEMRHQAVLIPKNMREGAKAFLEKRRPQFDGSRKDSRMG